MSYCLVNVKYWLLIAVVLHAVFASASTIYISPTGATSLPCGADVTPCNSIHLAIQSAGSAPVLDIIASTGSYPVSVSSAYNGNLSISCSGPTAASFHSTASEISALTMGNGNLWLSGLSFSGFVLTQQDSIGGALLLQNVCFSVTNCTFANNWAALSGGAIGCQGSQCVGTLVNSTFTGNSVNINTPIVSQSASTSVTGGGAVYCENSLTIFSSTFIGNSVTLSAASPSNDFVGGGAASALSIFSSNSSFALNSVTSTEQAFGGALFTQISLTISGGSYTSNYVVSPSAKQTNGGAGFSGGSMSATAAYFSSNFALSQTSGFAQGGALFAGGSVALLSCQFVNNSALATSTTAPGSGSGGAVGAGDGITVASSSFLSNMAIVQDAGLAAGGALNAVSFCQVSDSIFIGNIAFAPSVDDAGNAFGGAIYSVNQAFVTSSTFTSNVVSISSTGIASGGALAAGAQCNVTHSEFTLNSAQTVSLALSASSNGGAIYSQGPLFAYGSTFTSNVAFVQAAGTTSGGALCCNDLITIDSSVFTNNSALVLASQDLASASGGAAGTYGAIVIISSTFISNSVLVGAAGQASGGAISGQTLCTVSFSHFVNNTASAPSETDGGSSSGGAISSNTDATVTSSTFISNAITSMSTEQLEGGAIVVNNICTVTLCLFVNNSVIAPSQFAGGSLYGGAVSSTDTVTAFSSTFISNLALVVSSGQAVGGALAASNVCNVYSCLFVNNTAQSTTLKVVGSAAGGAIFSNGAFLSNSSQFVNNSVTVFSNSQSIGGAVFVANQGVINYSSFTLNSANSYLGDSGGGAVSGGVITATSSQFVRNSILIQSSGTAEGGAIGASYQITLTDCLFERNMVYSLSKTPLFFGPGYGGACMASNGDIISQSCQFNGNGVDSTGAAFGGALASYLGIVDDTGSTFVGNFANSTVQFGAVGGSIAGAIVDLTETYIDRSSVSSQSSNSIGGSVAYGALLSVQTSEITVSSATATGGGISFGGAIGFSSYLQANIPSAVVTIAGSFIIDSQADIGGGIYLSQSATVVTGTSFYDNSATQQGGALYMGPASNLSISESSSFASNTASAGGALFWDNQNGNIAPQIGPETVFSNNTAYYGENYGSFPVQFVVRKSGCMPLTPGCELSLSSAQLDYYNQPIIVPPTDASSVQVAFSLACSPVVSSTLSGWTNQTIQLVAQHPHQEISATASSSVFIQQTWSNSTSVFDGQQFTDCFAGSVLQTLRANCVICQNCPVGTYSLVTPSDTCQVCPTAQGQSQCEANAVYAGTNWWLAVINGAVVPATCVPGFCSSNSSFACPATSSIDTCAANFAASQSYQTVYGGNTTHCENDEEANQLGKVNGWCEAVNFCADNRQGFMCGDCISDQYSEWSGQCVDCSSPRYGLVALIIVGYWAEVVILYMFLSGQASSGTKTLVYFVQVSLLILEPSDPIAVALSIFNIRVSSSECLFRRSFFEAFIQHVFVLPVVLLALLLVSFGFYCLIKRVRAPTESVDRVRWLVRPLTAIALALYTPVTGSVLEMLQCQPVAGYNVVYGAPSYLCLGATHFPYFITAVVVTVLFVLGFPLGVFIALFRSRDRIGDAEVVAKWGYWYEAFQPKVYWWEVTVLIRRSVLTALSLSLTGSTRAIALSVVCAIITGAHHVTQPNTDFFSNTIEYFSLLTLVFLTTMNAGYFALSGDAQQTLAVLQDVVVGIATVCLVIAILYMSRKRVGAGIEAIRRVLGVGEPKSSLELPLMMDETSPILERARV